MALTMQTIADTENITFADVFIAPQNSIEK